MVALPSLHVSRVYRTIWEENNIFHWTFGKMFFKYFWYIFCRNIPTISPFNQTLLSPISSIQFDLDTEVTGLQQPLTHHCAIFRPPPSNQASRSPLPHLFHFCFGLSERGMRQGFTCSIFISLRNSWEEFEFVRGKLWPVTCDNCSCLLERPL